MSFMEQVLETSLTVPGVKVDRSSFLREQFKVYYSEDVIQKAIDLNPTFAGIPHSAIEKIAKSTIKNHVRVATTASFVAGLPGGFAMLGSIPADMAQFYANVVIIAQKLAYLYGWPDLSDKNDSEVLKEMVSLFLGVMFGISQANKVMAEISRRLAAEIAKRVPNKALTKYAWFNILKKLLKWLGVKLTKDTFAKGLSKVVPIVGGVISGGLTYASMNTMAKRLVKQLESGDLYNPGNDLDKVDADEVIIVDGITDVELTEMEN